MKKLLVVAAAMLMLAFGNLAKAGVSVVRNGSFEYDRRIDDITVEAPQFWSDVNVAADKFSGHIKAEWSTHERYSLTLYSVAGKSFAVGDTATVSQKVYLQDVNQISFDIALSGTHAAWPWSSEKFSATLTIDDSDTIWDSNSVVSVGNSEHFDVNVDIPEEYRDANSHILSLAMKVNSDETHITKYLVRWDFVKFDTHCGGFGYLAEDLDCNCYVDINDLGTLANNWLTVQWFEEAYRCDLSEDDEVNFRDFAILTNAWAKNSYWENWQDPNCFDAGLLATDLNFDGIVDFKDLAILAKQDLGSEMYDDISILAEEWLMETGAYQ